MKTIIRIIPLLLGLASVALAQANTGRIVVTVSDAQSGQYLQSANVEIPGAGRVSATDIYGVAEFDALAPGQHTVRVTYAGSKDHVSTVTVAAGAAAAVSIALESDSAVELERFVVQAERGGNAAAIARQKNALNIENIIAMDALGRLANDNPAELLMRMPGITSGLDTEGTASTLMVRGMGADMTGITVDGAELTSAGISRSFGFTSLAASNFDEIRVTKAPTPNMSADRLGGRIDFRTKPAFEMGKKRGLTLNLGGRWSPPFFDYSPRRATPALIPNLAAGWQETFSVFGGKRNLGITANLAYNRNITQSLRTISRLDQRLDLDENPPMDPNGPEAEARFTYGLERRDRVVDRQAMSGSVRVDYKFSKESLLKFTYNINTQTQYSTQPGRFIYDTYLQMSSGARDFYVNNSDPGAIMAGSTEALTMVRPRSSTRLQVEVDPSGQKDITNLFRLGGEHRIGSWKVDWMASYSRTTLGQNPKGAKYYYAGTAFYADIRNIGWILDKTRSAEFPTATYTAGNSVYDANNYGRAYATQTIVDNMNEAMIGELNLSRNIAVRGRSVKFDTGLRYTRRTFDQNGMVKRYDYDATRSDLARFVSDFDIDSRLGLGGLPVWDPEKYTRSLIEEPDAWTFREFDAEGSRRANDRYVDENIYAAYAMGSTNIDKLTVLAGVRYEWTDSSATGYRRQEGSTNRFTDMDQVESAYPKPVTYNRSYDYFFPGLHLRYRLNRNLQARASLHTSIGRPSINNLLPGFSVSNSESRITMDNPDLKPQYVYNYDLSLEYYTKRMGMFTIGVFRKDMRDFIYSGNMGVIEEGVDYGFDSTGYTGWDLYTIANGAKGKVDGIEIAFAQQLYFLPGLLKGTSVSLNYTKLQSSGDYGAGNRYALTGFTPETANARLSYNYHPLNVYVQWSYRSNTPASWSERPWLRYYYYKREIWNVGVSVKLPRKFELYLDIQNLTDNPFRTVRQGKILNNNYNGPVVICGIGGRF